MIKEKRLKQFENIDIYPVTCEKLSRGRTDMDILHGIIAGGAKIVQLREKDLTKREFYELAVKFREVTAKSKLLLIINDHLDIALAVGADGVHLGQDDLPVSSARDIEPDLIIGVSTHSADQALKAQKEGADYVNIGPVFPTKTKEGAKDFLGAKKISVISNGLKAPFTVMGGINLENVSEVIKYGARKVAVVSAITMSDDIAKTTKEFIRKIRGQ